MLNATIAKETLDTGGLLTILEPHLYNAAHILLRGNAKAFAFNRSPELENTAGQNALSKNMGEMIRLMKQRPLLEEALKQATRRVSAELTEENYAEQQRLRGEKEAFDKHIYTLTQRDMDI